MEAPIIKTDNIEVPEFIEVPEEVDVADPLKLEVNSDLVLEEDPEAVLPETVLNEEIARTKLDISENVMEQVKLDIEAKPLEAELDEEGNVLKSEIEVEIEHEEKMEEILEINNKGEIDTLSGELSVAEGTLGSEKSKLAALGGNAEQIIEQASLTSSVKGASNKGAPKAGSKTENSNDSGVETQTIKKAAPKKVGADNSVAIQAATSNISAASGEVSALSSEISAKEAEID